MRVVFQTERTELIALEAATAHAAAEDRAKFAQMIHATVPDAWPNEELAEVMPIFANFAEGEAFGGVLVRLSDRAVIGDAGYHRTPIPGADAEIGYSLIESARGQGYATEAVNALLQLGWDVGLVAVVARAVAINVPSHRVLARCGFICEGERDGFVVWRAERPVTS